MLNSVSTPARTVAVCRTKHIKDEGSDVPYPPFFFLLCYIKKMQSSVLLSLSADKLLNAIHVQALLAWLLR